MQIIYTLSKDIHISYDEFNEMPWYEILMILDEHADFIEAQNSESDNQNDMISAQQSQMEAMLANQKASMPKIEAPKMPQMPNFNTGNFNFN